VTTSAVGSQVYTSSATPTTVLLRRRGAVYLPRPLVPVKGESPGMSLLEADLVERGYLVSADLRTAFSALPEADLAAAGWALLADLDALLGADRPHVPLFRKFPDSVPADTPALFVDRVLTIFFQTPHQPCVLCGVSGEVHPVAPCAHLVCRVCFDGADYSACPICHRRIDVDDPFLRGTPPPPVRRRLWRRADARLATLDGDGPRRLRVLQLGADLLSDASQELANLLARTAALSPTDADDLPVLLSTRSRNDVTWLPARIPGRETKARVLTWLLADPLAYPITLPAVTARVDSATDVLRIIAVRGGGDAGLVSVPRLAAVPRPLRRALLALLDGLGIDLLVEDLRRYRRLWIHAAERLHPFEHAAAFPRAAAAFAVLRGTDLADFPSAGAAAAAEPSIDVVGGRLVHRSWRTRVEAALAIADIQAALTLLSARPGELLRRLDHLIRLSVDADGEGPCGGVNVESVLAVLPPAARQVSPAVLLSALGQLRTRDRGRAQRVFFPKGGCAKAHIAPEQRPPLSGKLVAAVTEVLTGEVLRRAALLSKVETAVVDSGLHDLLVPFTERTASRTLVTLPRGSTQPLPKERRLRLFVHWMQDEPGPRVDLDLAVALFDQRWQHLGTCDYTSLRFGGEAAVHSGDLTSAPPPQGASEFVDLDMPALSEAGARHAVVVVFSYNDVAFDNMAEAFAGFMARDSPNEAGEVFDPSTVEQRFDITGSVRAVIPLVVDLLARRMRWLDITAGVTGPHHAVHRHHNLLAALSQALEEQYASAARVSLGELAIWHAAARARSVLLRHSSTAIWRFTRHGNESVQQFAERIALADSDGPARPGDAAQAGLQFLLRGDLPAPDTAIAYALYPLALDATKVQLLTASDLAATLAP